MVLHFRLTLSKLTNQRFPKVVPHLATSVVDSNKRLHFQILGINNRTSYYLKMCVAQWQGHYLDGVTSTGSAFNE